jgi:hypothetical protein
MLGRPGARALYSFPARLCPDRLLLSGGWPVVSGLAAVLRDAIISHFVLEAASSQRRVEGLENEPLSAHEGLSPSLARCFQRAAKAFLDEYLVSETGDVPFGGRDGELRCLNAWFFDSSTAPRMPVTSPAGRPLPLSVCGLVYLRSPANCVNATCRLWG